MPGDVARAKEFLQDIDVMYAWEHAFSDGEVREMVARSMEEQEQWGYSFMLACLAESGEAIGRVGLRNDSINGRDVVELGYILSKKYWGKGYATELGAACLDYGFHVLGFNRIVAEIRPENTASLSVARRLGMVRESSFLKQCLGREIPHDCYVIDRGNAEANIPTIH